jgi:D-sedoheptulose 7-phosphate isomerase
MMYSNRTETGVEVADRETQPVQTGDFAANYKNLLSRALDTIDLGAIESAVKLLHQARENGQTIFVCGNGGSASTASHFACDMVKGASYARESRFRIMALTDSLPTITAYSNDVTYECVFAEQLKNFARAGDVVIAISGSGNSPNVIRAIEYAGSIGCETIALTGRDGGQLGPLANVEIRVAEPHMGRIEDGHMVVCHILSYYFMEQ